MCYALITVYKGKDQVESKKERFPLRVGRWEIKFCSHSEWKEDSSPNNVDKISTNKNEEIKLSASISSIQTNEIFLNLLGDSEDSASDESNVIDNSSIFLSNEKIYDSNNMFLLYLIISLILLFCKIYLNLIKVILSWS
jgi:hypothetical protein